MKRICVDEAKCICCGACWSTDPEHFELGENNKSTVISNENLESQDLQNAIEFCPTVAISIEEVEEDSNDVIAEVVKKECGCCEEECNECEDDECDCEECECDSCPHHEEE